MKVAIVLALLVAAAVAAPQRSNSDVTIVEQKLNNPGDGNFDWSYKTSDGVARDEHGELRKIGNEFGQAIRGTISWTAPDGQLIKLDYIADENGFQPQGAHLPRL